MNKGYLKKGNIILKKSVQIFNDVKFIIIIIKEFLLVNEELMIK